MEPDGTKEKSFVSESEYNKLRSELERQASESERVIALVQNLNEENQNLKKLVESFGGISPEEVKSLKDSAKSAKLSSVASDPEQVKKLLEEQERELREEFGKLLSQKDSELTHLKQEHKQVTVVSKALSQAPKIADDMRDFAEEVISRHVDRDQSTGALLIRDESGKVRYSPTNPAQLMTLDEFYQELKKNRPSMFVPERIQTGGIPQGQMLTSSLPRQNDGIDWGRVDAKDTQYIESLPRQMRMAVYKRLGV